MARSVSDLGPHLDRKFGVIGRQPARCDTHGEYSAVMLRAGGVSGCPICASDKRDMEELERKRFQFRHRVQERFAGHRWNDTFAALKRLHADSTAECGNGQFGQVHVIPRKGNRRLLNRIQAPAGKGDVSGLPASRRAEGSAAC